MDFTFRCVRSEMGLSHWAGYYLGTRTAPGLKDFKAGAETQSAAKAIANRRKSKYVTSLFFHESPEIHGVGETAIDVALIIGGNSFQRVRFRPGNELSDCAVFNLSDADSLFEPGLILSLEVESET
jgi:hypothetical protein